MLPTSGKTDPAASANPLLENLVVLATKHANDQLLAFSSAFAATLLDCSTLKGEPGQVRTRLKLGNLLHANTYAFFHLASRALETAIRAELLALEPGVRARRRVAEPALTLVPYEEMDSQVVFSGISRNFETAHSDNLATLNVRLAFALSRDILRTEQNPFRPQLFVTAVHGAWREFLPADEGGAIDLILPQLQEARFMDFGPLYEGLNLALMRKGVLPGAIDAQRIRKNDHAVALKAERASEKAALNDRLRQFFSSEPAPEPEPEGEFDPSIPLIPDLPHLGASHDGRWRPSGAGDFRSGVTNEILRKKDPGLAKAPLLAFLNTLQQSVAAAGAGHRHELGAPGPGFAGGAGSGGGGASGAGGGAGAGGAAPNVFYLPRLKQSAPKGSLSRGDENTIDLLSKIFETVFVDPSIPPEIRELIQFLQIPVLKAALLDKNFFFQDAHPARRMIDLLSRMGWEQRKGADDPVFVAMQRSVNRVGREFDQEMAVFAEAVAELETQIAAEEVAATRAIAAPIAQALKQEKMAGASRAAKGEVALRVGTGEVVAVVSSFLQEKWTDVLTIAYSVEDDKPGAVNNATRAMDDLIWSVKPKITQEQRRALLQRLPSLLLTLNKWLDIIKWQDAQRLRFFADLAECHASIVRAPLEASPARQVELAAEAARLDGVARAEQARAPAQNAALAEQDEDVQLLAGLERGMWIEFDEQEGVRQVKLAWVSPQRMLFIFSTGARQEAFSLSAAKLAESFREGQARAIRIDGVVGQALSQAMSAAVNDGGRARAA